MELRNLNDLSDLQRKYCVNCCQTFAWQDVSILASRSTWILMETDCSNGSVSFQLAQIRVGADKVPVSLVIYIDATYIKRGIPIRPIYCK